MTDAASDRARWTSAFADELAGFSPGPFVPEDEDGGMPLSPATRLTQSQDNARRRAKRARDKARKVHELGKLSVTLPFTHIHGQAWSVAGSASPVIG